MNNNNLYKELSASTQLRANKQGQKKKQLNYKNQQQQQLRLSVCK